MLSKKITYTIGKIPNTEAIINVYNSSGIIRPTDDKARIKKMYDNSNLVIAAWNESELVGISRAITDYCYSCYLSDLAIKKEFQKEGIGKELINRTRNEIGNNTALILLAAPSAINYYPKVGFSKIENGYMIKREI